MDFFFFGILSSPAARGMGEHRHARRHGQHRRVGKMGRVPIDGRAAVLSHGIYIAMIIYVYKGGTSRRPAETRRPRRSRRRALFEAAARLGRECWWVVGEQAGRKLHPKVESDISIDSESLELPRSDHERPAHDAVVGFQRGVGHPGVQQQAAHDVVALVAASAQACEAVPAAPS